MRPPPPSTLFPYTTLFRSVVPAHRLPARLVAGARRAAHRRPRLGRGEERRGVAEVQGDRKSTRLNSSHLVISYAVFCLKKKKKRHNVKTATKNNQHYIPMI